MICCTLAGSDRRDVLSTKVKTTAKQEMETGGQSMRSKALNTSNSPLTEDQAQRVNQLVAALAPEQLSWVSGYLAGLNAQIAGAQSAGAPAGAVPDSDNERLTVLYGSETGNAEQLAQRVGELAQARGVPVRVLDMADYKQRELRDERLLLIISATHGEGEPPDPAADFYEFLHSRKAPKLAQTQFAVLALGDSSYEYFCQTGRDFDARLEALGARRLTDRLDCDVDYETAAENWIGTVLESVVERQGSAPSNVVSLPGGGSPGDGLRSNDLGDEEARSGPRYDRRNPFPAEVLTNLCLNGRGSPRDTRHIELSLEGSGLAYQPGDVLCLIPRNRAEVVTELLHALKLDPEQRVQSDSGEVSLFEALQTDYEVTTLTPGLVQAWAERTGAHALKELVATDNRKALMAYLDGRHVIDLVTEFPLMDLNAETLLALLRRLQPREYSIASSQAACPDEVHLTVAAVRYESLGRERHGVASTFLADHAAPGETVSVYLRSNKNFRLPEDTGAPIIMVGPGTGVAPFRAFLQEREEQGARGGSWLFFGNPYFRTDFLYQTEWQRWLREGLLERMDVAFSRDGERKVYVQDRLRERGAEVFRWLQNGAHFYVCGDADHMAPDVHATLQEIVRDHGDLSQEDAAEYVKNLQREKRYQRDVY